MNEVTPKEAAATIPGAGNEGNGTADHVSPSESISTWERAGSISMAKMALRIDFESFGKTHTCFISPTDIRALIEKTMPATVMEIREGIDGLPMITQIGKAHRSRSGKALVITTSESAGEIMTPWTSFKKVIEGKVERARLSRLNPPPKPQPHATTQGISDGLVGRF